MSGKTEIVHYAEPLGNGRGIMRVDIVADGELLLSYTEGSPAPIESVRRHERRIALGEDCGA